MPLKTRLLFLATLAAASPLGAQRGTKPLDSSTGRIMFAVWESFADAAGRTRVALHVSTEKGVRCYAPLGARVSARRDTIVVDRWHLADNHGICLDDSSDNPAGTVSFPLEEGRRVLAIAHLGTVDRYRLVVTSSAIRVAPIGVPRVSVLTDATPLWRFPRNALALRCDTGEHTSWACAEVEHLISDDPGLVAIDFPAGGRNPFNRFRPEDGGDRRDAVRYYRVATPASFDRLVRGVQRLHDAYAGRQVDFGVSIQTWTGRKWHNESAR